MKYTLCYLLLQLFFSLTLINAQTYTDQIEVLDISKVKVGAESFIEHQDLWAGKSIGLVINHSSLIDSNLHIVDALIDKKAHIHRIFAPEHGFRGDAGAGESIKDGKDAKTGIPLLSLYGKTKKPNAKMLEDIDLLVFDIQDVGARFYTYISTMYYVMQAAAEHQIPIYILDRPNPNGFYVDGPVLDKQHTSFVGVLPIPVVHGMTIGELAHMIVGEGWIEPFGKLDLEVIPVEGYQHKATYQPPVPPSPNLPNLRSILLYPSLCFLEATEFSVGRGTDLQFQLYGHPEFIGDYAFVPEPKVGAPFPKHDGVRCKGIRLDEYSIQELVNTEHIQWKYLWDAYQNLGWDVIDRPDFMNLLMGTSSWKEYLDQDIDTWKHYYDKNLSAFKQLRSKYLIYP